MLIKVILVVKWSNKYKEKNLKTINSETWVVIVVLHHSPKDHPYTQKNTTQFVSITVFNTFPPVVSHYARLTGGFKFINVTNIYNYINIEISLTIK